MVEPGAGAQAMVALIAARPLASVVTPPIVAAAAGLASWPPEPAHDVDDMNCTEKVVLGSAHSTPSTLTWVVSTGDARKSRGTFSSSTTSTWTVAACVSVPSMPVTVTVYAPVPAEAPAETVSVAVPPAATLAASRDAETPLPDGATVAVRPTVPGEPTWAVVMLAWPLTATGDREGGRGRGDREVGRAGP